MVALSFLVTVGVEKPVLGLTGLLVVDRLFSGLYDTVLTEVKVCDLIVRHVRDLSACLHDSQVTERILFRVDGEQGISLFIGNIRLSGLKVEGVDLICSVDPGNALDGAETFGALSVPGCSVVLVVGDLRGCGVAVCYVRLGRHQDPARLHLSVDEGVVASVDLLIVLGGHHLAVGIEVVPALGSAWCVAVFL